MSEPDRTRATAGVAKWKWLWWQCAIGAVFVLALAVHLKAPDWGRRMRLAKIERQGDLAFQKGENRSCEACWRLVLEEHPGGASARNKLAVLCMKEGRFGEARRLLDAGIRRDPDRASFHYNLALLLVSEGDLHGALASAERVERINPVHGEIHFLKGVIYEQLGSDELARKEFIKELNVDPVKPTAWARLGESPLAAGGDEADGVSGKKSR